MKTDDMDAVKEQARYEIALDQFVLKHGIGAYTDTFEDLYGLEQLPGAGQPSACRAKASALGRRAITKPARWAPCSWKMAENREGATGFMEDYTYDLARRLCAGARICWRFRPRSRQPSRQSKCTRWGIGGKADPARLTFGGVKGDGVAVCMTGYGHPFPPDLCEYRADRPAKTHAEASPWRRLCGSSSPILKKAPRAGSKPAAATIPWSPPR